MSKMLRRVLTVIPAAGVQALWILLLVKWLSPYAAYITLALSVAAVLLVLFIIIKRDETAYKILWLLVILTVPVAGALLYLLFGNRRTARPLRKRLRRVQEAGQPAPLPCGGTPFEGEKRMEQTVRWLEHKTGYPLMRAEDVRYYPLGDAMYPDMLTDLRAAKKTIYLEYFIIEPGEMWQSIVDILAQKVREGLDVRVMYDDLGSISTFNFSNALALEKLGIRCVTFNPLLALKGTANYRDHRKMLIVDNAVAYSGGVNLADRYINREHPYGHWKDTGFRLTGAPVRSFTHMFLTFWNAFSLQKEEPMPMPPAAAAAEPAAQDGWVLSYYDSPLNSEATSNRLYIDLLSQATDYAWFFTPYLMLGDDLLDAMLAAAQRGVDVRIYAPGVPDKKTIYQLSRSYFPHLLKAGVKIYSYTPGFLHAKTWLIDDRAAAVGTVNLDYRSLYLHFENSTVLYGGEVLSDIRRDLDGIESVSRRLGPDDCRNGFLGSMLSACLRLVAPLC